MNIQDLQEKFAYAERDRDEAIAKLEAERVLSKEKSKRTGEHCSRLVGENKVLRDTTSHLVEMVTSYMAAIDHFMEHGKTAPGWTKEQEDQLRSFLKTITPQK